MHFAKTFSCASWITSSIVGGPYSSVPVPYFRRSFLISQPVKSAALRVTALGVYECEINGQRVGDEVFAPGWTEYHKRVYYQSYDVTGLLRPGENVLGAILGDGWYCGNVAWWGRQLYADRPRFLAQLEIILQDGTTITFAAIPRGKHPPGQSWKATC